MGALSLPGEPCSHRCGLEMPQILCLVLGEDGVRGTVGFISTGTPGNSARGKGSLSSMCCLQGLQCFCPPQIYCHFNWSPRQKKRETFTVLPAKFHLSGRNDPREQSKIMEIELKPLVCSCGSSGCRCLCAGIHRIWVGSTSLQPQSGAGGDGAHPAVIYIVQSSLFLQGKKNNHHFKTPTNTVVSVLVFVTFFRDHFSAFLYKLKI